ncbi:unnamed protein product [Orchesella dallaii]|uniref:Odorant receptor n=1 Tax=Orchesella dallaii TaxID=48710 RepID=A0ABP1RK51_9HEXA
MTTAFNKFVYRLNESYSSPWFLSILSWNHCSSEWGFETNKWKLFIHFFVPFGMTAPALFCICGMRFAANVLYPNVVAKTEQTTLLIVVALILYVLMIEVILFKHGNVIAQMTNKHAEFEKKNFYANTVPLSNKRVWEIKESLNSTFDWVGLFLLGLAVVAKPSVGLMMFLLVYTNNDPLFFASLGLSHSSIDACHSIFFNCLRYVGQLTIAGYHSQSMITALICLTSNVITVRQNLKRTFRMGIGTPSFVLYRQLQVAFAIKTALGRDASQLVLSTAFMNVMIFTVVIVKGLRMLPMFLFLFVLFMFTATIVYLLIAMKYMSEYYEFSNNGLIYWKAEVAFRHQAIQQTKHMKYMKKLLKSFRHIGIPVGDVGIVDTDIKTNYLAKTLEFTMNAVLVT